jgi:hypothetical protein
MSHPSHRAAIAITCAIAVACVASLTVATTTAAQAIGEAHGFVSPAPTSEFTYGHSTSLLTATVAEQVVKEVWPAFVAAANSGSAAGLAAVAAPDAADEALGWHVYGSGNEFAAYAHLEVTAPPEPSYPLSFFAEIDQPNNKSGAAIRLAVFGKKSAAADWLISFLSGYGGTNTTVAVMSPASLFATAAPASVLAPSEPAFEQMILLFDAVRDTGQVPPTNDWCSVSQQADGALAVYSDYLAANYRVFARLGDTASAHYTVANYSRSYSTLDGALVCATIAGSVALLPPPGKTLDQPALGSTYGPVVAAGSYREIRYLSIIGVCLASPSTDHVLLIGLMGSPYKAVVTPAS